MKRDKPASRTAKARRGTGQVIALPTAAPPEPAWMHQHGSDVLLDVAVVPRASRTRILDIYDDRLKIQLAAPPVDGQANDALVRFIAETLGLPRVQVEIVGGAANKRKTVRLKGVQATLVYLKLAPTRA